MSMFTLPAKHRLIKNASCHWCNDIYKACSSPWRLNVTPSTATICTHYVGRTPICCALIVLHGSLPFGQLNINLMAHLYASLSVGDVHFHIYLLLSNETQSIMADIWPCVWTHDQHSMPMLYQILQTLFPS